MIPLGEYFKVASNVFLGQEMVKPHDEPGSGG